MWLKEEIPADLYYSNNDRIQDIWLSSDVGYAIVYSKEDWGKTGSKFVSTHFVIIFNSNFKSNYGLLGMHGFDPHSADMHPIFFARGPDFANKREEQEPFTNLDLYPLCCFLLGIEPAPNNGSLAELHSYLGKIVFIYQIKVEVYFYLFCLFVLSLLGEPSEQQICYFPRKSLNTSNTKWLRSDIFFIFSSTS